MIVSKKEYKELNEWLDNENESHENECEIGYYNCCKCGKYTPEGEALVFYAAKDESSLLEAAFRLCESCIIELDDWLLDA